DGDLDRSGRACRCSRNRSSTRNRNTRSSSCASRTSRRRPTRCEMTTVGTEGERRSGIGTLRRTLERVRPRDLTSLAGDERSRERDRRIALTAVSSAAATGIGAVVSLITIPLTVRYLGTQGYGLWVTIASATALLSFADLGLSSGLVNAISETQATHDVRAARRFVASAFYLLVLIAGAIALGV